MIVASFSLTLRTQYQIEQIFCQVGQENTGVYHTEFHPIRLQEYLRGEFLPSTSLTHSLQIRPTLQHSSL